ncbi:MAG: outer membrane lipoprotein-sorting protein [Fimbriimonadia bacterium]|jgi:outer membrane lipoprotein-sorting protein
MTGILTALVLAVAAPPTFEDIIQTKLKDLSMTAYVISANRGELRKINNDFYVAYRFTSMSVKYKSPSKLRLDGEYTNTKITYILNGTKKTYIIPQLKQKVTEDTKDAPGKRQSMLDFGIVDPGVAEFMKGKFVREDRATGEWVFDLEYKHPDDNSRHRVWVDPKTKVITKREWYNQEGKLRATFYHRDIKNLGGDVFLPTTIEVRNVEGKSAGTTGYRNIAVNKGNLADSLFVP